LRIVDANAVGTVVIELDDDFSVVDDFSCEQFCNAPNLFNGRSLYFIFS
jgi:hypothetical protein